MSAAVSPAPCERSRNQESNLVYKSGPLFISSKGLGWKSWKRRWFILTRTSLVFFKNDPVSWEANLNTVALLFGHASDMCNNAELIRGKKGC
jgi:hypothetical protein